ncbi:uncharacterized protein LOC112348552 isoform X2 [Selaginella moellendorffii]|nr:uncharacterized protein LOC112348552 isoform X2 [Selaginella moellendorffii]|eukprot:XP_024537086.1 uncharacterized protein LOC112348552 isoform X2 [Selaginella moellendorffii]
MFFPTQPFEVFNSNTVTDGIGVSPRVICFACEALPSGSPGQIQPARTLILYTTDLNGRHTGLLLPVTTRLSASMSQAPRRDKIFSLERKKNSGGSCIACARCETSLGCREKIKSTKGWILSGREFRDPDAIINLGDIQPRGLRA